MGTNERGAGFGALHLWFGDGAGRLFASPGADWADYWRGDQREFTGQVNPPSTWGFMPSVGFSFSAIPEDSGILKQTFSLQFSFVNPVIIVFRVSYLN